MHRGNNRYIVLYVKIDGDSNTNVHRINCTRTHGERIAVFAKDKKTRRPARSPNTI